MSTVLARDRPKVQSQVVTLTSDGKEPSTSRESLTDSTSLGVPRTGKRFFWQRSKGAHDLDAIATLPSVYDDPETAKQYKPREDW